MTTPPLRHSAMLSGFWARACPVGKLRLNPGKHLIFGDEPIAPLLLCAGDTALPTGNTYRVRLDAQAVSLCKSGRFTSGQVFHRLTNLKSVVLFRYALSGMAYQYLITRGTWAQHWPPTRLDDELETNRKNTQAGNRLVFSRLDVQAHL